MGIVKRKLRIGGMSCVNCQKKIERKLHHMPGVQEITVSYRNNSAEITYDSDLLTLQEIQTAIEKLGYQVLPENSAPDIGRTVSLLVIMVALYVLLQQLGILNFLVPSQLADTKMGYGMLFLIGLMTSVHCIAMCGGINLSQCMPHTETPNRETGKWEVLRPSLLYNLGRVISYTLIGFLLGFVGMLFGGDSGTGISTLLQGILKMIAGVFMVIMGINMLGIFPWLRRFQLRIPRMLSSKIDCQKATGRQPLIVGLLNGLMPCGPLQAMQLVALASGNPFAGALSMLLFSLGTVPLMLGLGSLVTALGRKFARTVMGVGAVLVTVLGLAMLSQGGSLSGLLLPDRLLTLILLLCVIGVVACLPFRKKLYRTAGITAVIVLAICSGLLWTYFRKTDLSKDTNVVSGEIEIVDGVQVLRSTLEPGKYPSITVQSGLPVKWVIDAPAGTINGCNYKMLLKEYGIEHTFTEGENVIEFTPTQTGTVQYTCWMGMIRGYIYVTDEE